jgi:hypothetical protein
MESSGVVIEASSPIVSDQLRITESVGIETLGGVFTPLIEAGSVAPATSTKTFSTSEDNQTRLTLCLYRGNGGLVADNRFLGRWAIHNLRPARRGEIKTLVTVGVSVSGDISLLAKDASSQKPFLITKSDGVIIPQEAKAASGNIRTDYLIMPNTLVIHEKEDPVEQSRLDNERRPFLVAGYRVFREASGFHAFINCHVNDFGPSLARLIEFVPEPVAFAIFRYGDQPTFRIYARATLLDVCKRFASRLAANTVIEMVFDHAGTQGKAQLHVTNCRFFIFYGDDEREFRLGMQRYEFREVSEMATVDEFPITTINESADTEMLIAEIETALPHEYAH